MTTRADIQDRIEAYDQAHDKRLHEVGGAASVEEVLKGRTVAPGAYVVRLARPAGKNTAGNGVAQKITTRFAILIVQDDRAGDRGEDSSDELEALCDLVEAALLNWKPPGAKRGMEYGGGKLTGRNDGRLFWQENYSLPGQQLRQLNTPA